jgi:hypothetical protein
MADKIIFLDVDGVLNYDYCPDLIPNDDGTKSKLLGISSMHVYLLNKILKETGAKIVLSSTWRLHDFTFNYLGKVGIHEWETRLIGKTSSMGERGDEIRAWIAENNFSGKYIVIDDMRYEGIPAANMCNTNPNIGLTEQNAIDIINFLNG